jgi:hypothetical protein
MMGVSQMRRKLDLDEVLELKDGMHSPGVENLENDMAYEEDWDFKEYLDPDESKKIPKVTLIHSTVITYNSCLNA